MTIESLLPTNVIETYGIDIYVAPEFYIMKAENLQPDQRNMSMLSLNDLMRGVQQKPDDPRWFLPLLQFYVTFFNVSDVKTMYDTNMIEKYGDLVMKKKEYYCHRLLMSVITRSGHEVMKNKMKEENLWDKMIFHWFVDENLEHLYVENSTYIKSSMDFISNILKINHEYYIPSVFEENIIPQSDEIIFHQLKNHEDGKNTCLLYTSDAADE